MLSRSVENLIIEAYKKGKITSRTQSTFSILSFYIALRDLSKYNIFELDGMNGNEKIWKLTPKGRKVAELLIELRKLLKNDF